MKRMLIIFAVLGFLLSACGSSKGKISFPDSPFSTPQETETDIEPATEPATEPVITEPIVTEPVITEPPVTEPPKPEYDVVEPYILPVANPSKRIYDEPNGEYIENFGRVGYYVIVGQMEDDSGYTWGKLSEDRGWTLVYQQILPELNLVFCSGAGAWASEIDISGTGYFSGSYHDSDMGDTDYSYPYGTVYTCEYSGKFSVRGITPYCIYLHLASVETEEPEGKEWIKDGVRYIATDPAGLENCEDFILYLPGTPKTMLSEELLSWSHGAADSGELDCYVLYNPSMGSTFIGN